MLFVVRNCATERCAFYLWSVYYLVESSKFQTSEVQLLGSSLVYVRFQKVTFTLIKPTTLQWNQTWVHTKHESNIKKLLLKETWKERTDEKIVHLSCWMRSSPSLMTFTVNCNVVCCCCPKRLIRSWTASTDSAYTSSNNSFCKSSSHAHSYAQKTHT